MLRQLADKEEIDIRYYSIIYAAIGLERCNGRNACEGRSLRLKLEIFYKVGSIAGCMVGW
jgi:translation initiation factor IF-2